MKNFLIYCINAIWILASLAFLVYSLYIGEEVFATSDMVQYWFLALVGTFIPVMVLNLHEWDRVVERSNGS